MGTGVPFARKRCPPTGEGARSSIGDQAFPGAVRVRHRLLPGLRYMHSSVGAE